MATNATINCDATTVTALPAMNYYQPYPYFNYWPTYTVWPDPNTARIAELEGEVKVLREMVAALISRKESV